MQVDGFEQMQSDTKMLSKIQTDISQMVTIALNKNTKIKDIICRCGQLIFLLLDFQ